MKVVWSPPQREYKSLIYMGRVPNRINLKSKQNPYHRQVSSNVGLLGPYYDRLKVMAGDEFYMVEPSLENVNATIQSFDDAKFGDFRDLYFDFGLKHLRMEYGSIFPDGVADSEELASYIDWTKSAGYTATFHNIRSKGDLVKDEAYLRSEYHLNPTKTEPMVSVANKKELKRKTEILAHKMRLFYIAEFHLCKAQVKFGKRSSNRLKNYKWSAFGFSPFSGGVHQLAMDLSSKIVRFYYDVSGWDKFIPIMKDLYKIIFQCSEIPPVHLEEWMWMMKHTVEFYCCLYDGDVVLKTYGNCSGSGTTTRDNILMHIILAAAFLAEAYHVRNGSWPRHDLLAEQVVKLFGDDSVFAVDIEFEHVLYRKDEPDGFLRKFFSRLGMKLKFLHGGVDYPVEKMEFLGFRFEKIGDRFYPYYDPVRLATSFIYINDKQDSLEAYVSKCFVLTMMAFATECREVFLEAYRTLIGFVDRQPHLTPGLKSFTMIGPLTTEVLEAFYSGLETSLIDVSFFSSIWEDLVGIKDCLDGESKQQVRFAATRSGEDLDSACDCCSEVRPGWVARHNH